MSKVIAYLRSEPVRAVAWPLATVAIGLALAKGFIDSDTATAVTVIVGAVLGVAGAEKARSKVTPVANLGVITSNFDGVADQAREIATERFGEQGTLVADTVIEKIKNSGL